MVPEPIFTSHLLSPFADYRKPGMPEYSPHFQKAILRACVACPATCHSTADLSSARISIGRADFAGRARTIRNVKATNAGTWHLPHCVGSRLDRLGQGHRCDDAEAHPHGGSVAAGRKRTGKESRPRATGSSQEYRLAVGSLLAENASENLYPPPVPPPIHNGFGLHDKNDQQGIQPKIFAVRRKYPAGQKTCNLAAARTVIGNTCSTAEFRS